MNRSKTRRAVYLRIFAAFLAIYLVLMAGFSIFLISREKEVASLTFRAFGFQVNNTVEESLKDYLDKNNQITDIAKVKKELVRRTSSFTFSGTEAAFFTGDYNLILNTNGYWRCGYTEQSNGTTSVMGYGYLNPRDWFSEKEIAEIENYLSARPKAEKPGDLSGYSVALEGLWTDNEMIIPEKINVVKMYAQTFDESGSVQSASGPHNDDIVYYSDYQNTKGLPYFKYGNIQPDSNGYKSSEAQSGLRSMVKDPEKLKETVKNLWRISPERVNFLTYRYYLALPYRNTVKLTEDQNVSSEFWTVLGRDIDFWQECGGTLVFVWASCLAVFVIAAVILASQTYRTYRKQAELDKQRRETTNALAHDLKTPLSIISGYAQNLLENVHTEKRESYASGIQANVSRMDKIIREMLELSRLEADSLKRKFEDVSLSTVSAMMIERYKQVCTEKQITASLEGNAVIKADYSLLERVVDNFFVNALEHTPAGGVIQIKISEGEGKLEFFNSGSHIPEEKMDEIWQSYEKADTSRSNTKGTGLGLAIARTILELYHFTYGAKNNDDGVIFWFKFA